MAYISGTIDILQVTGNVVITVTTEQQQQTNLFIPNEASYNSRISGSAGTISSGSNGRLVTNIIDISSISSISVSGITEVGTVEQNPIFAQLALYSGSIISEQTFIHLTNYTSETMTFDITALKSTYTTATHILLGFTLRNDGGTLAQGDSYTENLTIYGS